MPARIVRKTIIPHRAKRYSSFPTYISHAGDIYLYYRQAVTNTLSRHGFDGVIKCYQVSISDFMDFFDGDDAPCLLNMGRESVLFEEGNEFDAIASRLNDNLFSLATCFLQNTRSIFGAADVTPDVSPALPVIL